MHLSLPPPSFTSASSRLRAKGCVIVPSVCAIVSTSGRGETNAHTDMGTKSAGHVTH